MFVTLTLAAVPAILSPVPVVPRAAPPVATTSSFQEEVKLLTEDKLDISAAYFAPRKKNDKSPAVLIVHDAGKDHSQVEDMAEYLNKKGFAVLALDVRGHGASVTEDVDWGELDERGREALWAFAGRDVRAGASYLRAQQAVHASNLTLIGVGAGCALAVRHAMDDENARAVVLIAPQPHCMGFTLGTGLIDLEGLPTLIVAPKGGDETARRLQEASHKMNEGLEYVEIAVMRSKEEKILQDSRLKSSIYSWLRDQVMLSKRK